MVNCEFGHFWADAKRGQIIRVDSNGRNPLEISSFKADGSPSGVRNWFKEHLPFKILKGGIIDLTEDDVDNAFNAVGITGVWDSRFRRVFFTKRDYKVRDAYKGQITFRDKKFYITIDMVEIEIQLTDETYFEDASWTIAYFLYSMHGGATIRLNLLLCSL